MFGVIRGCRCHLTPAEQRSWIGHLCGLCLTLDHEHGFLSRITTNNDALLLSVLFEAQIPETQPTLRHRCALRRFQRTAVISPDSAGSRFAAAVAMLIGATRISDHVIDGDSFLKHAPTLSRRLAECWRQSGTVVATSLGFDSRMIIAQISRQQRRELEPGQDFLFYSQPTEMAVGAAFGHTAMLAACPQNVGPLTEIGRAFGRIMLLFDSYKDLAADQAAGRFNALAESIPASDIQHHTKHLFCLAHRQIARCYELLDLPNPHLFHTLLLDLLPRQGHLLFAGRRGSGAPLDEDKRLDDEEPFEEPEKEDGSSPRPYAEDSAVCLFDACYCLNWCPYECCCEACCGEDGDCCDCDCCDCDCCDGDCCDCDCGDCDCGDCDCGDCDCGDCGGCD